MSSQPIRLLVVDDSALVRKILTSSLAPFPDIEVVGTAPDAFIAREKIRTLKPDVLTLDLEMPRMDGLVFLRLLMRDHPLPVVVVSSLAGPGSTNALEALRAGAVEVLGKPGSPYSAYEDGTRLAEKIRAAAQARLRLNRGRAPAGAEPAQNFASAGGTRAQHPAVLSPPAAVRSANSSARDLVLMGASTGGTEALREVLSALPGDLPGICVVQHIPALFSRAFAERLNQLCRMQVREAAAGDRVEPGVALVAPGGFHLRVRWQVPHYIVELDEGPPVHHQRPAVDVLFDSAVKAGAGPRAVVVLLTGMGADGARGMLALRQAGATTIVQDEETCVVFGMPREAIRLGAAQHVLPLEEVGPHLARHYTRLGVSGC